MTKNKKYKKGFTVIELTVVMTIFAIMSSITFFKFKDFDAGISLTNTVQEIALRIQKAQSDAINGVSPRLVSATQISPSDPSLLPVGKYWRHTYGIEFGGNSTDASHIKKFVYFMDRQTIYPFSTINPIPTSILDDTNVWSSADSVCDGSAKSECLDVIRIDSKEYIDDICVDIDNTLSDESDDYCSDDFEKAGVTFTRPFPDAHIYINYGGTVSIGNSMRIIIKSETSGIPIRILTINPLGQINVRTQ